jgi:hypothetical protein
VLALPTCRVIIMNHVIEHLPDPFATLWDVLEPVPAPSPHFSGCATGWRPKGGCS